MNDRSRVTDRDTSLKKPCENEQTINQRLFTCRLCGSWRSPRAGFWHTMCAVLESLGSRRKKIRLMGHVLSKQGQ